MGLFLAFGIYIKNAGIIFSYGDEIKNGELILNITICDILGIYFTRREAFQWYITLSEYLIYKYYDH